MDDQSLQSLDQTLVGIPDKWKEQFLIKRIDEKDIPISLEEQQAILKSLVSGQRFIQVGKYTLMLNSIKSIDPLWGDDNIPPCPKEITESNFNFEKNKYIDTITNQAEIDEWNTLFGDKSAT